MSDAATERNRILGTIAAGKAVDWDAEAASGALDAASLRRLRQVESIVSAHDTFLRSHAPTEEMAAGAGAGDLAVGTRISHFQILARLGAGGMGVVYRAEDTELRRPVALKLLPATLRDDALRRRRLVNEARAAGALNHTNIATVHEVGEHDGVPFIAMELVEGRSLAACILNGEAFPCERILDLAIQMTDGLAAAHDRQLLHRDLKPQNVMITPKDHVKILDFGLAKPMAPGRGADSGEETRATSLTESGHVVGTVRYMSPEQARGASLDVRSDIFAVGVILYEMATGRNPFEGPTPAAIYDRLLHLEPPPPSVHNPEIPRGLDRIIQRTLQKEARLRYGSAEELRGDLDRLRRGESIVSPPPRRPTGSRIGLWTGGVVVVAALASLLIWLVRSSIEERPAGDRVANRAAPARVSPFLTGQAVLRQPAWSPAGNLIAYVSDEAGNDDIWICDLSGGNAINLTADHPGADTQPAWSPDGQRIAFFSDREAGGIYTMTALGADVRRRVDTISHFDYSLDWSPQGHLVYADRRLEGDFQIFLHRQGERSPECLTCGLDAPQGWAGDLSPSGELLVYKGLQDGPVGTLYLANLREGTVETLYEEGCDQPQWDPGGDRIYFISMYDGIADLWGLDVDPADGTPEEGPHRLTSGLSVWDFTLSPDATRLITHRRRRLGDLWSFPASLARISDLALGDQLTHADAWDGKPRWFPDGETIVFESDRRGSHDIWKLVPGRTDPVRLTSWPGYESRPRVSPDGRWIAFDSAVERTMLPHLMGVDGSDPHPVDPSLSKRFKLVCCASWSPDGSHLVVALYGLDESVTLGILEIDPRAGTAMALTPLELPTPRAAYPSWSPNGKLIVYGGSLSGSGADLWVVTADGSRETHRLTTLEGDEAFPAWDGDSRFVYFQKDGRSIWRMEVDRYGQAKGIPRPWADPPQRRRFELDSIDIAGDRVLLVLGGEQGELWLAEFVGE